MPEKHLLLYLDAPMQAWGHSSRFNRRTSASWPTKSGIVGMLCAAMGIERDDEAGIARFAGLGMCVFVVKAEGGRLIDYHTVGGGYDPKTHRQNMIGKNAVLTDREYLIDHKFGVVLSGEVGLLENCAHALENPQWGIWFGRKNCIPAARICEGLFATSAEAVAHLETLTKRMSMRMVREVESFAEGTDSLMDVPVNFHTRSFKPRRIADETES
ncbi:type I-E CRISPR-associated protein Cas5/CasD [Pontiellaceae bacterium B12219]|nr:type I-E CRISPR-associated protein Cas5/CasD [Pontiellaceae bacterium B12219]